MGVPPWVRFSAASAMELPVLENRIEFQLLTVGLDLACGGA
jgi:hypothetical protein